MTDIWAAAGDRAEEVSIGGDLLRMVESQEQVATSSLVDGLAEQALLEQLIDGTKPPTRSGTEGLHHLLASPFRYPPLRHGSRFGSRFEPSLFYGSRDRGAALAETAYYRFLFWTGMERPPPGGRLLTQHSLFRARFRTERGLRLQRPPFDPFEKLLTDPADYRATQRLGRSMREAGVEAFEYVSARDPECGINPALFGPQALVSRKPLSRQDWLCETRSGIVSFSGGATVGLHSFALEWFQVDGRLPRPAA